AQARAGAGAIVTAGEVVEDALRPGRARGGQLVDDAAATLAGLPGAAGDRGAVEVPLRIERHAVVGLPTVRPAREAVDDALVPALPRRRQPEHGARVQGSALSGCSVDRAAWVDHQVGGRVLAVA